MEQNQMPINGQNPGMCGCDREYFQRVWRRVMPEEREGCPIQMLQENEMQLAVTKTPAAPAVLPVSDKCGNDFPADNDVPCLGAGSAIYGELLQEFITHEMSEWRLYKALARRAGVCAAKVLSDIAIDEYRHAKQLSTAYFLISGVQFWPERFPTPMINSYLGTLRRQFSEEQQGEAAYLVAADETTDYCLRELYLELAEDEADHSRLIRSILEQLT